MVIIDTDKCIKACRGDQNAFSDLMKERRDDLYKIAYTYVKNRDDALEILHNTVYKAFISIKKLKNPEVFNTWLTRIIVNCSFDYLKRKNKISKFELLCFETEELENYPDNGDSVNDLILGMDLFSAIDKLDVHYKTVVILKYFQGLTITQISESMAWPAGTVKTYLHKALNTLRIELKEGY